MSGIASCVEPHVTYADIIFKLDSSRRIKFDFFKGLSNDIVRLALSLLSSLDGGSFVDVALVVDVEFAEGIRQTEDVALLELRIFPSYTPLSLLDTRSGCLLGGYL